MNRLLTQAIREKRRIAADYAPVRKGTAGRRTLEPHALGVTKGQRLLRAWVREGASYSNGGLRVNDRNEADFRKRWRLFRVNQLTNVRLLPETFTVRNKYNAAGDKALARVLAQATLLPRTRSQVDPPAHNTRSRKNR
jgi:predicted DNA-binding transcriptional regulator YafY